MAELYEGLVKLQRPQIRKKWLTLRAKSCYEHAMQQNVH
jgi:hypothetical protein